MRLETMFELQRARVSGVSATEEAINRKRLAVKSFDPREVAVQPYTTHLGDWPLPADPIRASYRRARLIYE